MDRLEIVKDVTPESGRMDEQWDVETGKGTGARELTWCVALLPLSLSEEWFLTSSKNPQELHRLPHRHVCPFSRPLLFLHYVLAVVSISSPPHPPPRSLLERRSDRRRPPRVSGPKLLQWNDVNAVRG